MSKQQTCLFPGMYQTIKKQTVYYQKVGKGKDLILLHGWKQDVSTWWPLVDLLKGHFTLWLVDLPGFGKSENPKKIWGMEEYTNFVAQFIKDNKLKKPAVLGHSFGGSVAIKLASNYPYLVSKIILEASSGIRPKPTLKNKLSKSIAKIIKVLPNMFSSKELLRLWFYKTIQSDYLEAGDLKESFKKILTQDLTNDAKKIPHETLIIWGENDKTVPLKRGLTLYHLIKNSQIEVMEETGHTPHLKNSVQFINYVTDFI